MGYVDRYVTGRLDRLSQLLDLVAAPWQWRIEGPWRKEPERPHRRGQDFESAVRGLGRHQGQQLVRLRIQELEEGRREKGRRYRLPVELVRGLLGILPQRSDQRTGHDAPPFAATNVPNPKWHPYPSAIGPRTGSAKRRRKPQAIGAVRRSTGGGWDARRRR